MASISKSPSRGMRATSTNDLIRALEYCSLAMVHWTLYTPCGFMFTKKILIDQVDFSKVIHVLQEDLGDLVNAPNKIHIYGRKA